MIYLQTACYSSSSYACIQVPYWHYCSCAELHMAFATKLPTEGL